MVNKKSIHVSIRLPARLHSMVNEIAPLYENNFTDALCAILKAFEFSSAHKEMLEKLKVLRFYVLIRNAQVEGRIEELRKSKRNG